MSNHTDPASVFVIVPAYNEQETIGTVVDALLSCGYRVVVVDDGSSMDCSALLAGRPVYFLKHRVNLGQGAALQTGIEFALQKNARYVVSFDADGQHQAGDVDRLLEALRRTGSDIAIGSRFLEKTIIPARRRKLLQLARYLNYLFTGLLLTDAHNGLRAMTREAAKKIRLRENRMAHASEILSQIRRHGLKHIEVPVTVHYTAYSLKKGQNGWSGFRILFDLLLNKFFK